jgi:hypothetical protein
VCCGSGNADHTFFLGPRKGLGETRSRKKKKEGFELEKEFLSKE